MRKFLCAALLAMAIAAPARAQQVPEIRVLGAAVSTGGGLREVADAFTKKTGIKVTLVTGNMGTILADAKTATPAADLVMLPMDLMATLALDHGIKPGSFTPLGRLEIGLFKKPDAPFPDITTVEKLAAVMKAATVVTYTDPASGSMQATISAELLKRPEFAGVKGATGGRKPTAASPDGTLSLGVILGEPNPPLGQPSPADPSLIGRLPPELGAHMDMAAAISARTADVKNAQAFLAFLTSPEAVPLWAAKGTTLY
jgi:ABC-type molybdate transport system substrate-binding protein